MTSLKSVCAMSRSIAFVLLGSRLANASSFCEPTGAATIAGSADTGDWHLEWSDEFDGAEIDTNKWTVTVGTAPTGAQTSNSQKSNTVLKVRQQVVVHDHQFLYVSGLSVARNDKTLCKTLQKKWQPDSYNFLHVLKSCLGASRAHTQEPAREIWCRLLGTGVCVVGVVP